MSFKEKIVDHFNRNRSDYFAVGAMAAIFGTMILAVSKDIELRREEMQSRERIAEVEHETAKMQFCGGRGLCELEAPSL
jgi:hypothetical protein